MLYFNARKIQLFFLFSIFALQKGGRNEKEKTKSTRRIQGTVVT